MTGILKNIVVALKGFAMGAANVIPGVSGGTIALLTARAFLTSGTYRATNSSKPSTRS